VRPRHALLAFGAHRSPLASVASDHLPVKAIIAAHEARRSDKHDMDTAVGRYPTVQAIGRG